MLFFFFKIWAYVGCTKVLEVEGMWIGQILNIFQWWNEQYFLAFPERWSMIPKKLRFEKLEE